MNIKPSWYNNLVINSDQYESKEKDSSIAARNVENSVKLVENHVENFLINEYFSLQSIAQVFPDFAICIKPLLPAIVTRAERTLKQKRQGQRLTMKQILEWVEQERVFYQQSHNKDKAWVQNKKSGM